MYNQIGAGIAEAISYGANGATKVCDTYNDGYGASVDYMTVTDTTTYRLVGNNGHGTCVATANNVSNPIYALRVCSDRPNGGAVCSDWKYTGR